MSKCVFCQKIADEQLTGEVVVFEPLNPVTRGHLLVVPAKHVEDVGEDPETSAKTMRVAAIMAKMVDDVNIITSKGKYATQTVRHLHLHIVPRVQHDQLQLPWSKK